MLMKIAIPRWQNRISPVFDVACNVLLVDIVGGCEQGRREVCLDAETLRSRINIMVELRADVLVCGAISRQLEMGLVARDVKVVPHTCGNVEQVLAAYITGDLHQDKFIMPGCCGRRRRVHGGGQHWQNRQKGGDENAQR